MLRHIFGISSVYLRYLFGFLPLHLLSICSLAAAEDDIDDDGGTDEGCDGVEGDDAKDAGEEAQDVAQQGNDGTG